MFKDISIKKFFLRITAMIIFLAMITLCTIELSEAVNAESIDSIVGAYIIDRKLYVKFRGDPADTLSVSLLTDKNGKVSSKSASTAVKSGRVTKEGFSEFLCRSAAENNVFFIEGSYEIKLSSKKYPVVSVLSYRVNDKEKLTVSSTIEENGKVIPFCDNVYPVIYNNGKYGIFFNVKATAQSLDSSNWPKILRDGNYEEYIDEDGEKTTYVVTYAEDDNNNNPIIYYNNIPSKPDKLFELNQYDKLELTVNGQLADTMYWDQLSKIWYRNKTTEDNIDMVSVEGGTYIRGDWREPLAVTTYDTYAVNIKKLWLSIYDPIFNGEKTTGKDAVGVKGLTYTGTKAKDSNSAMWIINDDADSEHKVSVSDYSIGKYEITMDQFYSFINSCKTKSQNNVTYSIGGKTYTLNEVAARSIYNKKQQTRDNGWGMGERPAIDVNWYEACEYCNWLSLKQGFEPCYTFTNIYKGKVSKGLTSVLFMDDKSGSDMGKINPLDVDIQLCKVDCDFQKNGYRLPTEAEYEYAARGGIKISDINNGNGNLYSGMKDETSLDFNYFSWSRTNVDNPQLTGASDANIYMNNMGSNGYTSFVGSLLPNVLGIYDLSGNVWEMTWDYYSQTYYSDCAASGQVQTNPTGPVYNLNQLSVLDKYPVDKAMNNTFQYTYTLESDESYTRTDCTDVSNAGKFAHTVRGGCFTNPFQLLATVNRYAPGQYYAYNCINFTDARIGFRVARTIDNTNSNN